MKQENLTGILALARSGNAVGKDRQVRSVQLDCGQPYPDLNKYSEDIPSAKSPCTVR